jgi:hypothetical protein
MILRTCETVCFRRSIFSPSIAFSFFVLAPSCSLLIFIPASHAENAKISPQSRLILSTILLMTLMYLLVLSLRQLYYEGVSETQQQMHTNIFVVLDCLYTKKTSKLTTLQESEKEPHFPNNDGDLSVETKKEDDEKEPGLEPGREDKEFVDAQGNFASTSHVESLSPTQISNTESASPLMPGINPSAS